jgi:predicted dehydrogenase
MKASPSLHRSDQRRLRFGLVGCGEIAAESASALRAAANTQIVFAVDPNAELARDIATRSGAKHATELGALLECRDVDAVLISTPHHLHAPLAIECLRAGKHVIVEKPMATSVAECDQMIAAATAAGRHLSVCYCTRFDARVQKAKELLDEGVIGEVLSTHVVWAQHRSKDYWRKGLTGRSEGDWRAHKRTAGGGVLIMNACHLLDMMMWMLGRRVVDVVARTATLAQPVEVEDTVSLTYTYEGGALGTLSASTAHAGPEIHDQRIQGRDGQLNVAPGLRSWSSRPLSGRPANRWVSEGSFEAGLDRRRYFERLADAILDARPLPVTADEARSVQEVIERAYRSSAQASTI